MTRGTTARTVAVLLLVLLAGATLPASAGAPLSRRLYAYQDGCGDGPARLRAEVRAYTTGCGFIGGLPVAEVATTLGQERVGVTPLATTYRYLSDPTRRPLLLDRARAVTGQVAAERWGGDLGVPGAGQVTWDLQLWGITPAGKAVPLGSTTVSAIAAPDAEALAAPFRFVLPRTAGQTFRAVRLDVLQRGANVGMTARRLGKHTWVALPLRAR